MYLTRNQQRIGYETILLYLCVSEALSIVNLVGYVG